MLISQYIAHEATLITLQADHAKKLKYLVGEATEGLKGQSGYKASIARCKFKEATEAVTQAKAAIQTHKDIVLPTNEASGPLMFFAFRYARYQHNRKELQDELDKAEEQLKTTIADSAKDSWKFTGKVKGKEVKRENPRVKKAQEVVAEIVGRMERLDDSAKEVRTFVTEQEMWEADSSNIESTIETADKEDTEEWTVLPKFTNRPYVELEPVSEGAWTYPNVVDYLAELAKATLVQEEVEETPTNPCWNWNTPAGKLTYLQRLRAQIQT